MPFHPLLPDISKFDDQELAKKISDAAVKLTYARRLGNDSMINQIQLFLSHMQDEQYERGVRKLWADEGWDKPSVQEFDWETLDDGKGKEGWRQQKSKGQQGGTQQRKPQDLQPRKGRRAGPPVSQDSGQKVESPRTDYVKGAGIIEGEDPQG